MASHSDISRRGASADLACIQNLLSSAADDFVPYLDPASLGDCQSLLSFSFLLSLLLEHCLPSGYRAHYNLFTFHTVQTTNSLIFII